MLQIALWTSKNRTSTFLKYLFVGIVSAFFFSGCATPRKENELTIKEIKKKTSMVYPYKFESVWRAAQISLKYPIATNNMENGVLETEWIRATDGFLPPTANHEPSSGIRYKITINMVKGSFDQSPSVRVSVFKKIERQRDFFSEIENIQTDALEEIQLLYRIEREIVIDEALKKASSSHE